MTDTGIRSTSKDNSGLGWLLRQDIIQLSPESGVNRFTLDKPRGMDAHHNKKGTTKAHEAGHDAVTVGTGGNNGGGVPVRNPYLTASGASRSGGCEDGVACTLEGGRGAIPTFLQSQN
eukprot:14498716-Alexandrium_andersonii.AAC.1